MCNTCFSDFYWPSVYSGIFSFAADLGDWEKHSVDVDCDGHFPHGVAALYFVILFAF